ncbi:hypothetical protein ACPA9J_17130 [Pseudomonas aeruginosa]
MAPAYDVGVIRLRPLQRRRQRSMSGCNAIRTGCPRPLFRRQRRLPPARWSGPAPSSGASTRSISGSTRSSEDMTRPPGRFRKALRASRPFPWKTLLTSPGPYPPRSNDMDIRSPLNQCIALSPGQHPVPQPDRRRGGGAGAGQGRRRQHRPGPGGQWRAHRQYRHAQRQGVEQPFPRLQRRRQRG